MSVTSWSRRSSVRARFAPTFPPPAMTLYIRPSGSLGGDALARRDAAGAHRLGQNRDRRRGRAYGPQPAGRVELRTRRVEDPDHHAVDVEALLRDLPDDEVRVVAVRRDDGRIRLVDAGFAKNGEIHAVPDDEASGPVLAEARERLLVLVDDGNVPAAPLELARHARPDSTTSDNHCLHELNLARNPVRLAKVSAQLEAVTWQFPPRAPPV